VYEPPFQKVYIGVELFLSLAYINRAIPLNDVSLSLGLCRSFPYAAFFMRDNNSIKEEDIGYVEPERLNIEVLRAATNNFSEENKLGEGGFGEVFKVHQIFILECGVVT